MRVLIVRTGAMGDVLHALPAVAALRAARPDWTIDWVIDPRWQALLADGAGHGPIVDRVHRADTRLWSRQPWSAETLRSILSLRRALRAQRYDLSIDVQGTIRSGLLARFTRAPRRFGFSDPREAMAAHFYTDKIARYGEHVVEQNAALVSAASGITLRPGAVALPPEPWADNWAKELVGERKICILAPSAGWAAKRWPAERFGQLAIALRGLGLQVLVNASRKDDPLPATVVVASDGAAELAVCNVTGLIALTRRAALVVGGDSGPIHLAAALAVPALALFGPTDPARNGPWSPTGGDAPLRILRDPASVTSYKRSAIADPGLANLPVEDVLRAIEQLLRGAI